MVFGITDITTFILGTIFIILLPGPNSLYVMAAASRYGYAEGFKAALGIMVGDSVLMVLAALGAASLLNTTPALFNALQLAGAAYLIWLGYGLVRSAFAVVENPVDEAEINRSVKKHRPFQTATAISLLNPKGILFFVSFFVQFVDPGYDSPALSFLILGIIVQIASAAYLTSLIYGGAALAKFTKAHATAAKAAVVGVGLVFIGFGGLMAVPVLGSL